MWMRRLYFLTLMGLYSIVCNAQDEATRAVIDRYPREHAIIWNRSQHLEIEDEDGRLVARSTTVEEKMLLDEQAVQLANTESFYYSYFNKLDKWSAVTLVPQGSKYREVKATQSKTKNATDESVFYDDTKETEITFNSLSKYSRTRLEYSLIHSDMHFLPGFYFQGPIPIHEASFKVTVPKNVKLGYLLQGYNQELIKMTTEDGRRETTYTWTVTDMPKVRTYSDGPDAPYYIPHLLIYVSEYTPRHSKEVTSVFSKTDNLYNYYYPFIKSINKHKSPALEQTVDSIIKDARTPDEKAERIYKWVQQNIRYIAFEDGMGGFIPREAASICTRRYGDCKDMSSLLVAMCRYAGLDAYFTWIGTRNKPYKYSEVPLPITDNHMIGTVKLGDNYVFMDGTDPSIPFGIPPYNIQGKEAMIAIDSGSYKIIRVPEMDYSRNAVTDSTHLALDGNKVKGRVDILYKGYPAWSMAIALQYRSKEEQKLAIKSLARRGSDKYQQTDFNFTPEVGKDRQLSVHSDFYIDGYARKMGNEWYINLNMQRTREDDFADTADRKVPMVYKYKNDNREVVTFDIPAGFAVDYLPPSRAQSVPGLWSYKISYHKTARQVQLIKEYQQYTLYISPAQFHDHNRMVDELRREYKESVVLKAIP
jgi:transglutaminase-like putative cysteine protease